MNYAFILILSNDRDRILKVIEEYVHMCSFWE